MQGAMSQFIPKMHRIKADISASVWQQVSAGKWTVGHFYLLALMLVKRLMDVQGQLLH